MDKISRRSRNSENTPPMTDPLFQRLSLNGMTEWGDNVLLGKEVDVSSTNMHIGKFLKHLKSITGAIP